MESTLDGLIIRPASRDDAPLILAFIRELAEYERLAHEVVADESTLERTLFGERAYAEVLTAEMDGAAAAFALFFHNYSTFLGRPGLYLEDLFVKPAFRGCGIGRAMLGELARIAVDRECGRLEWWVLDWNTSAIGFYEQLGARAMDDWTVFRVDGNALLKLADG